MAPRPLVAAIGCFLLVLGVAALIRPGLVIRCLRWNSPRLRRWDLPYVPPLRRLFARPEYLFFLRIYGVFALGMGAFVLYIAIFGNWSG